MTQGGIARNNVQKFKFASNIEMNKSGMPANMSKRDTDSSQKTSSIFNGRNRSVQHQTLAPITTKY
jgi:hypothetical protein